MFLCTQNVFQASLVAQMVKNLTGLERSLGGGNGKPTPVFLPGVFHGQRSLASYSPQGHNESDMTEQLTTHTHTHTHTRCV